MKKGGGCGGGREARPSRCNERRKESVFWRQTGGDDLHSRVMTFIAVALQSVTTVNPPRPPHSVTQIHTVLIFLPKTSTHSVLIFPHVQPKKSHLPPPPPWFPPLPRPIVSQPLPSEITKARDFFLTSCNFQHGITDPP
ncbi:hypothetical protein RRG08_055308 [Elysia crispata]|uniref:Uncharacterized protein n=1 Tax=Elysia crispata TaxID=231223 RepID=A0AAE1ARL2_9GAST|nr:hypothetical protein RRG08_055308 [Elysia crispata]